MIENFFDDPGDYVIQLSAIVTALLVLGRATWSLVKAIKKIMDALEFIQKEMAQKDQAIQTNKHLQQLRRSYGTLARRMLRVENEIVEVKEDVKEIKES